MKEKRLSEKTINNVIWICWLIACLTRNNYIIMSICIVGFLVNAIFIKKYDKSLKHIINMGIFMAIILGNLYVLRSAAIIVYPVLAFIVPTLFYTINEKIKWLSIPVVIIIELIIYRLDYSYYEARPLFLILTLVQILIMVIIVLLWKNVEAKKNSDIE